MFGLIMLVVSIIRVRLKMTYRVMAFDVFVEVSKEVSKERMTFVVGLVIVVVLTVVDAFVRDEHEHHK